MSIHSDFSEWFLAAGVEPSSSVLEKRWEGLLAFKPNPTEIISLVELFFGFYDGNETFIDSFRVPFKQVDAAFRTKDNNAEMSVLAGAKLVSIMEGNSPLEGDFAAMAIVSCATQNLRTPPRVNAIVERAATHLNSRAISRHKPDPNIVSEDDATLTLIKNLQRELTIVAEESNVLWWVFGETSRDTERRWSECTVSQAAFMAGKELADLSRIPPGPAAAAALLDRVVKSAKGEASAEVVLSEAVANLSLPWRHAYVKSGCPLPLLKLCPVSHCVKLSVEWAAGEGWIDALPTFTKLKSTSKITPRSLSYQVFIERMLASLWPHLR